MNKKDNNKQIPVQALELLPWYALGLLEAQEKKFVEKALLEFPELQEHLKIEHEMVKHLHEEKELFSLSAVEDREERLGQLLNREEFQPKAVEKKEESINTRLAGFFKALFSGDMSKSQYMGFAAITTVSIALLFAFAIPLLEHKSTFYPAAVKTVKVNSDKNTLLIGLSVEPNNPKLLKILSAYNVKTTAIAGKDGMYRLGFVKAKPNPADLKKLLSTLSEQTDLVWFVGEAY
jgi:hypothetical protein